MAARDGTATALANVHRLDKGTSGLLVLSKNKHTAAALGKQFKTRKVQKTYWAALDGQLAAEPVRVALTLPPWPLFRSLTDLMRVGRCGGCTRETCGRTWWSAKAARRVWWPVPPRVREGRRRRRREEEEEQQKERPGHARRR
jgi:hypothetical protein